MKIVEMIDVLSKAELKPNGDYANVEIYDTDFEKWMLCVAPSWNFRANEYRIKPATKRIALTQQDLIDRELSGETMRINYGTAIKLVVDWDSRYVFLSNCQMTYEELKSYNWLDNSPCYKEVECE